MPQRSSTLRLIEDIVHSLDTGEPPRGGVRVAYASTELIFGFIESHRRGGVKSAYPVERLKYTPGQKQTGEAAPIFPA